MGRKAAVKTTTFLSETRFPVGIVQRGIPSVVDDMTSFPKSLGALNNNSNFCKSRCTLACNAKAPGKKSRGVDLKFTKHNIREADAQNWVCIEATSC
jgi:hypothetical protein